MLTLKVSEFDETSEDEGGKAGTAYSLSSSQAMTAIELQPGETGLIAGLVKSRRILPAERLSLSDLPSGNEGVSHGKCSEEIATVVLITPELVKLIDPEQ